MPARPRRSQDAAAAPTPGTTSPTRNPPTGRPPAAKPPAGGAGESPALEARVRALEETVNGLASWARDTHRALVQLSRHLEDLVAERLVPRPPPPPPIKPRRPTRPR